MKTLINNYSFAIRTNDLDFNDYIRPTAILDFFQSAAGRHAEEIGVGYQNLLDKNLAWVLVKTKYIVLNKVSLYDKLDTFTWPSEPNRIEYNRNYRIVNSNNEIVVEGVSKWCIVDSINHRISREKVSYNGITHNDVLNIEFDKNINKENDISQYTFVYDYNVCISDLDHNHHMNNSRYADVIMNALDTNTRIMEFEINYNKECQLNDKFKVYKKEENEIIKIIGVKENGDISFKSILKVEK